MRIKFKQAHATKEANPQTFNEGDVVEFADDEAGHASSQHYLKRGLAEEVDADTNSPKKGAPKVVRNEAKADGADSAKAVAADKPAADDKSGKPLERSTPNVQRMVPHDKP